MRALMADTYRRFGRASAALALKGVLVDPAFRVLATLRLCQALARQRPPLRWLLWPARVLHRMAGRMALIEVPWRTQVGAGLALTHGQGIVISDGARLGANVTLFHGCTLGRGDLINEAGERQPCYPVVEDEVWIGPHAIVVGGITIGRGSRIAGGAFVNRDLPPYSVALGNPARIVRRGCAPDVYHRAPLTDG